MTQVPPAVIPLIISQHAEETAFRRLLRDDAITNTHYNLNELSSLETYIDGLRVAEQSGWKLALKNLQHFPEPG